MYQPACHRSFLTSRAGTDKCTCQCRQQKLECHHYDTVHVGMARLELDNEGKHAANQIGTQ